jgi:hypothetical protein
MRVLGRLVVLAASVFISGCTTPTVVPEYKTILVSPPDDLLVDCAISPPPFTPESYMVLSWEQREEKWTAYTSQLFAEVATCNNRPQALRHWKVEQENLYNKNKRTPARE